MKVKSNNVWCILLTKCPKSITTGWSVSCCKNIEVYHWEISSLRNIRDECVVLHVMWNGNRTDHLWNATRALWQAIQCHTYCSYKKNTHFHVTKAIILLKSWWKLLHHIWKPITLPVTMNRLNEVHKSNSQCGGHICLHPHVILITKCIEQVIMKF
jgi:hypothetical protein